MCISSTAERHKTTGCVFLPWQKYIKQLNVYFFHGRNTKNNRMYISSMAERQKTTECVFLPWQKYIKQLNVYFFHGRNTENTIITTE